MKRCKLGDFLDNYGDGIHGTPTYDEKGNIYFINGNNLQDGMVVLSNNIPRITQEEYLKIARPLTEKTILLSINGTLGNIAIYHNEKIALGKSVCFLNVKENENPYFVKYVLSTQEFKKYMFLVAHGSTIKNLAPSQVADYEFAAPDTPTQNQIASLLKGIDDKIALNNRVNTTLEAMAKTLYDYWFVQFDFPDEKGRPYKTSGGKMVYNEELGREIPAGWEVVPLKQCVETINTGLNPRKNFLLNTGGTIKYITVKNLTETGEIDFSGCDYIDDGAKRIIHNRSCISQGDILFASIAPLGRCFLIQESPEDWEINESVFSIRPNNLVNSLFLYMYFRSNDFIKSASSSSAGSIFKGIRINTLLDMPIILPSQNTLESYLQKGIVSLRKMNHIWKENRRLAALRDWLLPMLMNGQVGFKKGW